MCVVLVAVLGVVVMQLVEPDETKLVQVCVLIQLFSVSLIDC